MVEVKYHDVDGARGQVEFKPDISGKFSAVVKVIKPEAGHACLHFDAL